jgi:hypothetical protein
MTAGSRNLRSRRSGPNRLNDVAVEGIVYIPLCGTDQVIGGNPFRLRVKVWNHPVAQHRTGKRLNVGDRHVIAAENERTRLAGKNQRLRRAQPRSPFDPFANELVVALPSRPRGVHQPHGVPGDFLGDDHLSHQLLNLEDVGAAEDLRRGMSHDPGGVRHHPHLFVLRKVGHDDVEHESIELGFGKRVGALELDGILRREHEEGRLERIRAPGRSDVVLLHGFEQCGLGFRRRPVDLVSEQDLREDRPLHKAQRAVTAVLVQHFGASDVRRHQVRCELDPLERQVENLRDCLDQQRLRQSGHARDQAVPPGEERHQYLVDHFVLADDHFSDFCENPRPPLRYALGHCGDVGRCRVHQWVSE